MAEQYNPKGAYFVFGDKKVKGSKPDKHITDLKQLNIGEWTQEYQLFKSPSNSKDSAKVYKEYTDQIKEFLMKNPNADVHEARKTVGVMLTADGREAITAASYGKQRRLTRELQQKTRVVGKDNKPIAIKDSPAKYQPPHQKKYLKQLHNTLEDHFGSGWVPPELLESVKFEGHHIKGLGSLDKFFEGANIEEAFELRQVLINKGFTAGETHGNFAWLSPEQHDLAHKMYGEDYDFEIEGKKGVPSFGETEFPRSKDIAKRITDAPFKRDSLQQAMLDRGEDAATIKRVTGKNKQLTRADYLSEWLDQSGKEFDTAVEKAVRAAPVKGLDPELQILANKKLANPEIQANTRAILQRSGRKFNTGRISGGLGKTESLMRIAAGDYVGGTMGLAMQTDTFRNRVMKELLKRGGKSAAKLMPGVGVTMGALETAGYASQGRFTQSAIAAFGAAAGEIPGIGDIVQGGTDLLNTGIDIATGNFLPDSNLDDEYLEQQKKLTRRLRVLKRP
tara:strand:+ start:61 stop:1578 length:1518 start_codon:yes stop_codon:yes gene_type:complete